MYILYSFFDWGFSFYMEKYMRLALWVKSSTNLWNIHGKMSSEANIKIIDLVPHFARTVKKIIFTGLLETSTNSFNIFHTRVSLRCCIAKNVCILNIVLDWPNMFAFWFRAGHIRIALLPPRWPHLSYRCRCLFTSNYYGSTCVITF